MPGAPSLDDLSLNVREDRASLISLSIMVGLLTSLSYNYYQSQPAEPICLSSQCFLAPDKISILEPHM
jgi:hypothetical protein